MVWRLLAVDHHNVQAVLHLLLLLASISMFTRGPDRGGRVVDLAPGERVVWILQVERSDGVEVEVELAIITSVQNRTAL